MRIAIAFSSASPTAAEGWEAAVFGAACASVASTDTSTSTSACTSEPARDRERPSRRSTNRASVPPPYFIAWNLRRRFFQHKPIVPAGELLEVSPASPTAPLAVECRREAPPLQPRGRGVARAAVPDRDAVADLHIDGRLVGVPLRADARLRAVCRRGTVLRPCGQSHPGPTASGHVPTALARGSHEAD